MAPIPYSLTVRGRRLARELRTQRERTGMTMEQAAARLGWNRFKLSRLESGKTRAPAHEVAHVLDLYGVSPEVHAALVQLARDADRRGWWAHYSEVLSGTYMGLEDEASEIRSYQVQLVPGLLQQEAYARLLISAEVSSDFEEVERRLRARMARRTLLTRPGAPRLRAVLHEAALRLEIGSAELMFDQLHELIRVDRQPNVEVRVLPFTAGGRAGLEGPFVIFGSDDPLDQDVVYTEGICGDLYIEAADQVARCNLAFEGIWEAALHDDESVTFIREIATSL